MHELFVVASELAPLAFLMAGVLVVINIISAICSK